MYQNIETYCLDLTNNFVNIKSERKLLLDKISNYIALKHSQNKPASLAYICTHNSRRSHFGQVWAHVASIYYNISPVHTFSGGTEASAFNTNAINALKRVGFSIEAVDDGENPTYHLSFSENEKPIVCFSKAYDNLNNPQKEFAAIMVCSDAEENCPFIPGAELRISTTYDDPKDFDGTAQQNEKYDERCKQIALETLYVFSKVKQAL